MDSPSTVTFGAGSGSLSDPAHGLPRPAPAVAEIDETAGGPPSVASSHSSENAHTALSAIAETVSAVSVPAPAAVAVNPGGGAD
eukprot:3316527-Alexandrium_andersonii.AAC.1